MIASMSANKINFAITSPGSSKNRLAYFMLLVMATMRMSAKIASPVHEIAHCMIVASEEHFKTQVKLVIKMTALSFAKATLTVHGSIMSLITTIYVLWLTAAPLLMKVALPKQIAFMVKPSVKQKMPSDPTYLLPSAAP